MIRLNVIGRGRINVSEELREVFLGKKVQVGKDYPDSGSETSQTYI